MKTENRDVTITLGALREGALLIVDALRSTELTKLPHDHLALVHAYQLGVLMRAVGLARNSITPVLQFVQLGYDDYGGMKVGEEGGDG